MRKFLFIGAGGAIGAAGRYLIKEMPLVRSPGFIPFDTILINSAGCLAIAVFLSYAANKRNFDPSLKAGVSIGLIGAFTTFSTVCKEFFVLIDYGNLFTAFSYIAVTIFFGLFSIYAGTIFMIADVSEVR